MCVCERVRVRERVCACGRVRVLREAAIWISVQEWGRGAVLVQAEAAGVVGWGNASWIASVPVSRS